MVTKTNPEFHILLLLRALLCFRSYSFSSNHFVNNYFHHEYIRSKIKMSLLSLLVYMLSIPRGFFPTPIASPTMVTTK